MVGGGQPQATVAFLFPREGELVTNVQEAAWALRPVWAGAKNLATTGIRSPERPFRSKSLFRHTKHTYVFMKIFPIFAFGFNQIQSFLKDFLKTPIHNLTKIRLVGAVLIHADRQTDRQTEEQTLRSSYALFGDLREEGLTNLTLTDEVLSLFYREQYRNNWVSM